MVYGLSLIIHLFPLSRHQQKEHPGSQKQPLDGPGRRREGESRLTTLLKLLKADGRLQDLDLAIENEEVRKKLYLEYHIE